MHASGKWTTRLVRLQIASAAAAWFDPQYSLASCPTSPVEARTFRLLPRHGFRPLRVLERQGRRLPPTGTFRGGPRSLPRQVLGLALELLAGGGEGVELRPDRLRGGALRRAHLGHGGQAQDVFTRRARFPLIFF